MDFSPPQQDRSAIIQIDSALNQWIDSVPEHCTFTLDAQYSVSDRFQCVGILIERTKRSSIKQLIYIPLTTISKFSCIDLSSLPAQIHRSHPSLSARTQPGLAVMSWIFNLGVGIYPFPPYRHVPRFYHLRLLTGPIL